MINAELVKVVNAIKTNQETEEKDAALRIVVKSLTEDNAHKRQESLDALIELLSTDILQDRYALTRRAGITLLSTLVDMHCFKVEHDAVSLTTLALLLSNQMDDWHSVSAGLIPILTTILQIPVIGIMSVPAPPWLRNPWRECMVYKTRSGGGESKILDLADLVHSANEGEAAQASFDDAKEHKFLKEGFPGSEAIAKGEVYNIPLSIVIISSLFVHVGGNNYSHVLRRYIYTFLDVALNTYSTAIQQYLGPRFVSETLIQMTDEMEPGNLLLCFSLICKMRALIPDCFIEETPLPKMPHLPGDDVEAPVKDSSAEEIQETQASVPSSQWNHAAAVSNFLFSIMPFSGTKIARMIEESTEVTYDELLKALREAWVSWEDRLAPVFIDIVFDQFATISEQLDATDGRTQILTEQLVELVKLTADFSRRLRMPKSFRYIMIPLVELAKLCLWTARPTSPLFSTFPLLVTSIFKSLSYRLREATDGSWFPIDGTVILGIETSPVSSKTAEATSANAVPLTKTSAAVIPVGAVKADDAGNDERGEQSFESATDMEKPSAATSVDMEHAREVMQSCLDLPSIHIQDDKTLSQVSTSTKQQISAESLNTGTPSQAIIHSEEQVTDTQYLSRGFISLTKSIIDLAQSHHRAMLPPHPRSSFWLTTSELISAISSSSPLGALVGMLLGLPYFWSLFCSEIELIGHGLADDVPASRLHLLESLIWNFLMKVAACRCHNALAVPHFVRDATRALHANLKMEGILEANASIFERGDVVQIPLKKLKFALEIWRAFVGEGERLPNLTPESWITQPLDIAFVTYWIFSHIRSDWPIAALDTRGCADILLEQSDSFLNWFSRIDDVYSAILDRTITRLSSSEIPLERLTDALDWSALSLTLMLMRMSPSIISPAPLNYSQTLAEFETSLPSICFVPLHCDYTEKERALLKLIHEKETARSGYGAQVFELVTTQKFANEKFEVETLPAKDTDTSEVIVANRTLEQQIVEILRGDETTARENLTITLSQLEWSVILESYMRLVSVLDFGRVKIPFTRWSQLKAPEVDLLKEVLLHHYASRPQSAGSLTSDDVALVNLQLKPEHLATTKGSLDFMILGWLHYLEGLKEVLKVSKGAVSADDRQAHILSVYDFLTYIKKHKFSTWQLFVLQRGLLTSVEIASFLLHAITEASSARNAESERLEFMELSLLPLIVKMEWTVKSQSDHPARVIRDLTSLYQCTLHGVKSEVTNMIRDTRMHIESSVT